VTTSGVRVRFTGGTDGYLYSYLASGAPASCAGGTFADGVVGSNNFLLAGGPWAGECGSYRLCGFDGACLDDMSAGVVLYVCVDAVGGGTCTVM